MLLHRGQSRSPNLPDTNPCTSSSSSPFLEDTRVSAMTPYYLLSNSNNHTRPFSAIAELLDNAVDPDVAARMVFIDVEEINNKTCLTFTDDGCGMTPHKLQRMLSYGNPVDKEETEYQIFMENRFTGSSDISFGVTDKGAKKSQSLIGVFGNGFKSGSMRLGKDVLVFTKNEGTLTVGLLSRSYLECTKSQAIMVPIVPFSQQSKNMIVTDDSLPSLEAILNYSVFKSVHELLSQFDAIPGQRGTRVLIWNIRRNKDGKTELDFATDRYDIRVSDFDTGGKGTSSAASELPEAEYSLRTFCSILYMKPRMKIFLRQHKVTTQLVAKNLAHVEYDLYKPSFTKKPVRITFGYSCMKNGQFGVMMYYNNRLIKSFQKVGCQLKTNRGEGVGVIGVIECNFLKPAYNKQSFEYTKEYRLTMNALGQKLNNYWKEKISQNTYGCSLTAGSSLKIPDETWVQCDECLKWRKLPVRSDPSLLPTRWFCYYNPNPEYRRCSVAEEYDLIDEVQVSSKATKQKHTVQKKGTKKNEKQQVFTDELTDEDTSESDSNSTEYDEIDSPYLISSSDDSRTSPPLLLNSQDSRAFESSSKYKWTSSEEPFEKRRKLQKSMTAAPTDYSMTGPYRRVEAAVSYLEDDDSHDECSDERSEPPRLFPEYPETSKHTSQNREVSGRYLEARGQRQGSLLSEELDQMPKLVAEGVKKGSTSKRKDVSKGPFVAVVGVAEGVSSSGAVQLIPFKREQLAQRKRVAERWHSEPSSTVASATTTKEKRRGSAKSRGYDTPKLNNQNESEELKRTTERLQRALAERNIFQQKVEELEQERNHWVSEFEKVQRELMACSTKGSEGLYWSKKHMGYRQAEFQLLKDELEKTKGEKQELKAKLKETEAHLAMLQKAQATHWTRKGENLG